ncbi:glycosyl transferase [Radiomyces spectabilis]|uniref:glycosyl transferase n=1 Tax=Radiomyces spectabilis TaxID=64574 RepID=UPI00221F95CA|nr:glycosyl transferase [Radiomyces spectabilis]KAI8394064.1 glycosyl transferase [Radiomyces spectabilis]
MGKEVTEGWVQAQGPLQRWLDHLVNSQLLWSAPLLTVLFATVVRCIIALNPYSGYATPPMFGDYEAQRHWMEITQHLPTWQWYRYELNWWGLDYPPLTAFHSWLCGIIGSKIDASMFALDTSRGLESMSSKMFMRCTVLVSEAIIYIPAVLTYCLIVHGSQGFRKKHIAAVLILMQPGLLMIDHGHFQFNSVMLGLTLWAVNAFLTGHWVVGSIFFCLSLLFKQMALYYAPAVFGYLLGQCLSDPNGWILFVKLGVTVILTFACLFSPWLSSLEDLQQVIHRIFPVARGLYEDKVANVWCTLNIFIKLRHMLSLTATVRLSLVVTLMAVIPITIHTMRSRSPQRFLYALVNSSLAFFLFSFQVHEKSILLPALPVTLLVLEEPLATHAFINTAMFSMYPLLKREDLVLPYFVTLILWNWLMGDVRHESGSLARHAISGMHMVFVAWYVADGFIAAPARYPDLYAVINAALSCGIFGLLFLYYMYRSFNLESQKLKVQ